MINYGDFKSEAKSTFEFISSHFHGTGDIQGKMMIMPLRNGCKESNEQTRKAFHGKVNFLFRCSVKNGKEFLLKQARDARRSNIQDHFSHFHHIKRA